MQRSGKGVKQVGGIAGFGSIDSSNSLTPDEAIHGYP
jgi:hypothetical protein